MARYDVRVAALALDVPYQWLDSLLARHHVLGVTAEVQGVRRSLTPDALARLTIARDLHESLGLPIARALEAADRLLASGVLAAGAVTLSVDRHALETAVAHAAAEAVDRVVPRRRGRPPKRPESP